MVEQGMMVKFHLVPFATCLLHLKLLLQGSFHQEEVKSPHFRDSHRPNIMKYLEPPEHQITRHLPPFLVCQKSATTVAHTYKKKNSLLKHMLVVLPRLVFFLMKKIFIFNIPVRRKIISDSPATNILIIKP